MECFISLKRMLNIEHIVCHIDPTSFESMTWFSRRHSNQMSESDTKSDTNQIQKQQVQLGIESQIWENKLLSKQQHHGDPQMNRTSRGKNVNSGFP